MFLGPHSPSTRFTGCGFASSFAVLLFAGACSLLTSCSSVQQQGAKTLHINLQGRAMGGEQPITAATVQLYQVGTITDGGGATPLINQVSTPVTTSDGTGVMNSNANAGNNYNQLSAGYFTITGDYTCSGSTLVYLATIGGNPGIGSNNAQEQIAALGPCSGLNSNTYITINEITTVGAVKALLPYMSSTNTYSSVSSTPAHASALATAFTTASEYVNTSNGIAPGPNLPGGYDAASNDLRALANVVQNCVNSNGSVANGSNCGTFFTDAQGTASSVPGDTVTALYDVFSDPTNNVTTIFNLQGTTPAFEPTNNNAPPDWTLPILQAPATPVINPNGGSITSTQNITITDTDTDGTTAIYYTTDGSTPSATNGTLYTGAFTLPASATVNAIAIDDNRLSSSVASATFTVTVVLVPPTVSLSSVTSAYGTTTPVSITASSNAAGSVVTFSAGSVGGSFSPATCTIASGSCSVSYLPSGSTAGGTYSSALTASFAATQAYLSASASSTLFVSESSSTYAYTLLHSFAGGASDGAGQSGIVQGPDGNFYGVTQAGGSANAGTLYKLVPNGTSSTLTVLHTFTGTDGATPFANLTFGTDGNLYGVTTNGGANSAGTLFEYTLSNSTFTSLYSFTGGSDGQGPFSGLIQASDGLFYGTTTAGGDGGSGTLFRFQPNGASTTVTEVHGFAGGSADGDTPYSSRLVQASNGAIYGTTQNGGNASSGTIFSYTPSNSTFAIVHSFNGGSDGQDPFSGLVQGADGLLYGATSDGGNNSDGTAYSLDPATNTFTLLHSFTGSEPSGIQSALEVGTDGNFYGVSNLGGSGKGTVFQLVPNGTGSTVKVLESLTAATGANATGNLIQGADGNFYGTTSRNAAHSDGGIFELAPTPSLAAPITVSAPADVAPGYNFTLTYSASNAWSLTAQQCFAANSAGDSHWTGAQTVGATAANVMLTAPVTNGTYTYGLTCGGQQSGVATVVVSALIAPPTIFPAGGTYSSGNSPLSVTITTNDPSEVIYYTTDGSTPTTSSAIYTGAISVSGPLTIKAISAKNGVSNGGVTSATYAFSSAQASTLTLSSITVSPGSTAPVSVTATSTAEGATVNFGTLGPIGGTFSATSCIISSGSCSVNYTPTGTLARGAYANDLTVSQPAYSSYAMQAATATLTVDAIYGQTPVTSPYILHGSTTPVTVTATSAANGSVVSWQLAAGSSADGTFSPTSCTIASGSCSVTYVPSGVLPAGTYSNAIEADFGATGNYAATSSFGTLSIEQTSFSVVVPFTGTSGSFPGAYPYFSGTLMQASDGNYYGTTANGSPGNYGEVYEINPTITPGNTSAGQFSVQIPLTSGSAYVYGSAVQGSSDQDLYFVANSGNGIYKFALGSSTATTLWTNTSSTQPKQIQSGLIEGTDGNFYGVSTQGGSHNTGSVFRITPSGTLTILYNLSSTSGSPVGQLLQVADGSFWGTFTGNTYGGVFHLSFDGSTLTSYRLNNSTVVGTATGYDPNGGLIPGPDGFLYGTAELGGTNGHGTVFKVNPSTGAILQVHSFSSAEGTAPSGSLVLASDGNFYGTNSSGGSGSGTVFQMTPDGNVTVLRSLSGNDGADPLSLIFQDSKGNLWGTTDSGGFGGYGTLYQITFSPALPAPVQLVGPFNTITHGSSFGMSYSSANAYSATAKRCFATNTAGDAAWSGVLQASPTMTTVNLTAPATAGTYTYTLTCGGTQTTSTTVTFQ